MNESTYQILTPAGAFSAVFGEEDSPVEYQGDGLAIGFFKDWILINQISGEHGHLLDVENIQPNELYGFCQSPESGITVIPPFVDLVVFAQADALDEFADQTTSQVAIDDETQEENTMQDTPVLDSVSGLEKLQLVGELGALRKSIASVESGIEKLKIVKRISEIRSLIGVNSETEPAAEELKHTTSDVNKVMPLLKKFIGKRQLAAVGMGIRGEESQFFKDKMVEIANTIQNMPQTYGQDGMGDKAVAYLHYFMGGSDWYITEKDMDDEQLQAFGLADLGHGGELGYISIQELIDSGVELDFHWSPKTIGEVKGNGEDDSKDPNIGREWNSKWGRQKIVGVYEGDLYEVKTLENEAIRRYPIKDIEETISKDEYRLTTEYAEEQAEREKTNRQREDQDARSIARDEAISAEIAKFTSSIGMSPPNAERVRAALLMNVVYEDGAITRKSLIEKLVSDGRSVEEKEGERALVSSDGNSYMLESEITKTGMDYAEYLISQKPGSQEAQANQEGSIIDSHRKFLELVVDGTANMDSETFSDQIEKAAEALGDDNDLVAQAANAYVEHVTKKSKELL